MITHSLECESCGVWMSASDAETLRWGIDSHVCAGVDPLEMLVVRWLDESYGGPFWLFRPGLSPALVRL